eukprot:863257-Rhodomonas_salina.1
MATVGKLSDELQAERALKADAARDHAEALALLQHQHQVSPLPPSLSLSPSLSLLLLSPPPSPSVAPSLPSSPSLSLPLPPSLLPSLSFRVFWVFSQCVSLSRSLSLSEGGAGLKRGR